MTFWKTLIRMGILIASFCVQATEEENKPFVITLSLNEEEQVLEELKASGQELMAATDFVGALGILKTWEQSDSNGTNDEPVCGQVLERVQSFLERVHTDRASYVVIQRNNKNHFVTTRQSCLEMNNALQGFLFVEKE